ncbi:hypothetical protein GDO81_010124 [Engystomops pustulosus]|uniref:Uncharacterized protein n=1 Tax=Engystomops pustulosus TaxID=76066 RepID=A0AAV7BX43_ENGPU|nr:hypothetical protein GDO81_010124 [Engystomops pustulosus]
MVELGPWRCCVLLLQAAPTYSTQSTCGWYVVAVGFSITLSVLLTAEQEALSSANNRDSAHQPWGPFCCCLSAACRSLLFPAAMDTKEERRKYIH